MSASAASTTCCNTGFGCGRAAFFDAVFRAAVFAGRAPAALARVFVTGFAAAFGFAAAVLRVAVDRLVGRFAVMLTSWTGGCNNRYRE
jgi:hypothetical protein